MPRDVFAEYKELLECYREVRRARRSHRIKPYSGHDKYVARLKEFRWEEGKIVCPRCKIRCARVQEFKI